MKTIAACLSKKAPSLCSAFQPNGEEVVHLKALWTGLLPIRRLRSGCDSSSSKLDWSSKSAVTEAWPTADARSSAMVREIHPSALLRSTLCAH